MSSSEDASIIPEREIGRTELVTEWFLKHTNTARPPGDVVTFGTSLGVLTQCIGETVADAAAATGYGVAEHCRHGAVRAETAAEFAKMIRRLYQLRGITEPVFAKVGVTFGAAVRHFGKEALRAHIPDVSDAVLDEKLSWLVETYGFEEPWLGSATLH